MLEALFGIDAPSSLASAPGFLLLLVAATLLSTLAVKLGLTAWAEAKCKPRKVWTVEPISDEDGRRINFDPDDDLKQRNR
ncbi:MAG TPA: hypothetical protein VGT08_20255 [Terracidiphilus sp.]|nr:hypothetical protein [Terracidiphilus sp.]